MLKDSLTSYGWITIVTHWISALLVIFLFSLGVYMVDLSYYDEWYHKGPALHVSLGLILAFVTIFRLLWRSNNQTPIDLSDKRWNNFAARWTKRLFYVLLLCIFITGYLITTAEGKPATIFDVINIPALTELQADQVDLIGEIHEYAAWIIIILAALHAAGALLHHFVYRDQTLMRIFKVAKKMM